MVIQSKQEELFAKFLSQSSIFVVDSSSASRTRLIKTLIDLGATTNLVKSFKNYEEAEQALRNPPQMVLTDYKLGGKSGFDLLQAFKKVHEQKKSIFILVTSNASQNLVAQAAEEEIDSYILKPYTLENLKDTLIRTTLDKLYPNEYVQTIEMGKELLFGGKATESIELFKKATELDPKPSLAYFYLGQAEFMQQSLEGAEDKYLQGLSYNKIHYKCLIHLFNLLMEMKRFDDAYEVVKRIAKYFPANPKRLTTVLRLAIHTANYKDINNYYEVFKEIEPRTEEIVRYMCASLIICGKYFLLTNSPGQAMQIFEMVKTTAAGNPKFLLYIIQNLVEFGYPQDAPKFLERFGLDTYETDEFLIADFLASDHKANASTSIKKGLNLIERNKHHYCIHFVLIKRYLEGGNFRKAMELFEDALKRFPDKKVTFNVFVKHLNKLKKEMSG